MHWIKLSRVLGVLLIVLVSNNAFSVTIGHDVINRATVDSWRNFSMVDLSLQFSDAGQVDSWSFFAKRDGLYAMQIYRNVGGTTYEVVAEDLIDIDSASTGISTFSASSTYFSPGDFIGWTMVHNAGISFDSSGPDVVWPLYGGMALGVGSQINLTYLPDNNHNRTYSVAAEVTMAPIPEPGTIVLLGSGLAVLAGYGRKRRRQQ